MRGAGELKNTTQTLLQNPRQKLFNFHRRAAEKIKRENDVHLRQLANKSTYVLSFFNNLSTFPKTNHRGNVFFRVDGGFFPILFLSILLVALVKRLSVRGTKKT
jgi:hypothetical protein